MAFGLIDEPAERVNGVAGLLGQSGGEKWKMIPSRWWTMAFPSDCS